MKKNIILQAPVFSLSGYGAHARDIALSLLRDERFNVSIIPTGWGQSSTIDKFNEKELRELIFGVNNHINQKLPFIFIHLGIPNEFERRGAYNVGITAGLESTKIPELWVQKSNQMDLIVVPTKFMKDTFLREGVTTPIIIVNEGVDTEVFNTEPSSIETLEGFDKITTKFNFLSVGQWINYPLGKDRKQIGLLIDTFAKTFSEDEDVGLILKTYTRDISSPDRYITKSKISQIKANAGGKGNIYLLHGELTPEELAFLYKNKKVNAYVSMTSGEGWNRPVAEACACGMPIVITGWSGHMDYLYEDKGALIINHNFIEIPPEVTSSGLFQPGMRWAFPDVQDTILKMRQVRKDYVMLVNNATIFSKVMQEKYNKEQCYKILNEALSSVSIEEKEVSSIIHKAL